MNSLLIFVSALLMTPCAGVKTGKLVGLWTGTTLSAIYDIDFDTGRASVLSIILVGASDGALTVAPDGQLYATFTGGDTQLLIINPETGDFVVVGFTGFVDVCGLEFGSDGTLYGYDAVSNNFLTLDVETGAGTVIGPLGIDAGGGGLALMSEAMFMVDSTGFPTRPVLHEVNVETGAVSEIGIFGIQFTHTSSAASVGETLYASAFHSTLGVGWLVEVDRKTGNGTIIGVFDPDFGISMYGMAFLPGPGDVDRDGDVDLADYDIFVACFTGPLDPGGEPLPVGCVFLDSDDDSDIDCLDWEAFIVNWTEDEEPPTFAECDLPPTSCEGDANGDNVVDPLDAGFVQARFGCPVNTGDPECDAADVSTDGAVDPLDVGFVLARFGDCP